MVLSGGMAKGAYQVGALRAVSDFFALRDFAYVSAASIGCLNAYAFLTNQLDTAKNLWLDSTADNYSIMISSILRSAFIQNSIKHLISEQPIENNFYIPLLDIKNRTLSYFDLFGISQEDVEPYLTDSVALPIFNTGVSIKETIYIDGAMVDNIPVFPLVGKELDYIILLYFDNQNMMFESAEFDNRIIKLNFPDPSLKSSLKLTRDEVINMIDLGYCHSKRILEYIFKSGIDDAEEIRARIKKYNSRFSGRKVLLSGDILVRQMNKVVKKFARTEIISSDMEIYEAACHRKIIPATRGDS